MATAQFNDFPVVRGHTVITNTHTGEVLFDSDNALFGGTGTTSPTGIKALWAQALSGAVDRGLDDLFTTSNVGADNLNIFDNFSTATSAAISLKDGIVVYRDGSPWQTGFACVTTTDTPANTYGRKWVGVINSTVAQYVDRLILGHRLRGDAGINDPTSADEVFTTVYATQTFDEIFMQPESSITISWEIYIQN